MAVYLHRTGYIPRQLDPDTGEILAEAKNTFEKVVAEPEDVGSYSLITLNRGKPSEVTVLLDRPMELELPFMNADGSRTTLRQSELDPTGLVASFCSHGLELHPVTGKKPHGGQTWVKSLLLTLEPGVPPKVVCHCLHADDLTAGCPGDGFHGSCPNRDA